LAVVFTINKKTRYENKKNIFLFFKKKNTSILLNMLKYEIFSFKIGIITIGINNIIKRCLKLLKNNINNILRLYPAVKVIGLR
jgi:hypothetical protein